MRLGTTFVTDSLNPFVAQVGRSSFEYIYPSLVQYDTKLNIVGDFATKWDVSADGLTWTFHTIPGSKWSDGMPLTAKDAEWTLTTILKYKGGPAATFHGDVTHITGVDMPDQNTLVVHYDKPTAVALSNLQRIPVLPEHIWGTYAAGDGAGLKTFLNDAPIVSGGPFTLTQFQKGESEIFQRNPNYYGPKPIIDGFGYRFFTNDDAEVLALKNGEIDQASVPATAVDTLKSANLGISITPGIQENYMALNSNPLKPRNRELLDPKVRLAFDYAIDRKQIVQVAFLGYAQPGASIIPPVYANWSDPNVKPLPFDLSISNSTLDQAGYPKGSDGIRVANGHKMQYDVIFPPDTGGAGSRSFEIIRADFAQIGVVLNQRPMDDSAAFDAISAPNYTYLSNDIHMWDWTPSADPDSILSAETCAQYGGASDTGYCDSNYDAMYQQQGTLIDQKQRQQLVYKMQEQLYNDRPYIFVAVPDDIEAYSHKWAGFVWGPAAILYGLSKLPIEGVHQVGS